MTEEEVLTSIRSGKVRKLSGTPDHWLTTFSTGLWGINDDEQNQNVSQWKDLTEGDVCLFHSTGKTRSSHLPNSFAKPGIIGVGTVESTGIKDQPIWLEEVEEKESKWKHIIYFNRAWWFGEVEKISKTAIRTKRDQGYDHIKQDVDWLISGHIPLKDYKHDVGKGFPSMQSISGFDLTIEQFQSLSSLLGRHLSEFQDYHHEPSSSGEGPDEEPNAVPTGTYRSEVLGRIGQDEFSQDVRENYGHQCCFPGCEVRDDGYLIGAHIARWSDRPDMRGDVGNGLCLCLHHDKAFEVGHFTIDEGSRVWTNEDLVEDSPWATEHILPYQGEPIDEGDTSPHLEALKEHWKRHELAVG